MKTTKPSLEKTDTFGTIPFYSQAVPAGFPSPADDFLEFDLSLDKKLIKHPSATFFVRASGTSMINAKIFDGSILLVDRAEKINNGDIVLAVVYVLSKPKIGGDDSADVPNASGDVLAFDDLVVLVANSQGHTAGNCILKARIQLGGSFRVRLKIHHGIKPNE